MLGTAAVLTGSWAWTGSRPDLVLLEGTEQGPGGRTHGIDKDARLHLVEVTFTNDFALVDRVAS